MELNMKTCSHFAELDKKEKKHILKSYEHQVNKYFGTSENITYECNDCTNDRNLLLSCLSCDYMGCITHIQEHHSEKDIFYLDLSNASVLCTNCQWYICNKQFDKVLSNINNIVFRDIPNKFNKLNVKILYSCFEVVDIDEIRGIDNLGSICYMNCVLQSLFHSPTFRNFFFSNEHFDQASKYYKCSNLCFSCEIKNLMEFYFTSKTNETLEVSKLITIIWKKMPELSGRSQKDCHEFLIGLFNQLQQEAVLDHISQKNVINMCFSGKLQSDVVCLHCNNVSTTLDPILDVELDIPQLPRDLTLTGCLAEFTRTEQLSTMEYRCNVCNDYRAATKRLTFLELPTNLIIHFKRFSFDGLEKLTNRVNFQQKLNMANYLSTNTKNLISDYDRDEYDLYAVIEHQGRLSAGHYTSYVKSWRNNSIWYRCNDTLITTVDFNKVVQSQAYLLFYHKKIVGVERLQTHEDLNYFNL